MEATIHHADEPDSEIIKDSLMESAGVLGLAGAELTYEDVIADKGYHKAETLAWLEERGMRAYASEPKRRRRRKWGGKPGAWEHAYRANPRRSKGARSSMLHRLRSERVERSFAHTCRTGRARRTWLRGIDEVGKRYMIQAAARNLGTIMRSLFGIGTPRALQSAAKRLLGVFGRVLGALCARLDQMATNCLSIMAASAIPGLNLIKSQTGCFPQLRAPYSTAC